ncbi:hypothetical protein GCM10027277_58090 [Pseudoduganella ginsengisoli]|uniref:EF-hand domain-containing protein n=1 Tax=Pseudoduganella ginsengisoli TaxID=1462440 RepID=A0A6L6PXU1_9BURK|nr:hypothetical protein [Pseudoduganella ginsengisoli]MTW02423.1 hypothetical protein [Pseudoduganella ginsengisoli]
MPTSASLFHPALQAACSMLLAVLLLAPPAWAANEDTRVEILPSSHPAFPALDRVRVERIVRTTLLEHSTTPYLLARIRVQFAPDGIPLHLVVYLAHANISQADTARITLAPGYVVSAVDTAYQQRESDLEPGTFTVQDADMLFETPVDFIATAAAGVRRGCELGAAAGYACDVLLGSAAGVQDIRNYLLAPRLKALGNIGHGNPNGIQLADGMLTNSWFATLPAGTLAGKLLYFNSCQVHNAPLEPAIMGAGARTYIGGNLNLPIGGSEEVFKCFWNAALNDRSGMGAALGACEEAQGLTGFHGLSGDAGRFTDNRIGDDDGYHAGDTADHAYTSPRVQRVLAYFAGQLGQHGGAGLDTGGSDRPVGLTHVLALPPLAQVTAATVTLRLRGTNSLVKNDVIFYNDSVSATEAEREPCAPTAQCDGLQPFLPYIALRDLLGAEPRAGVDYLVHLNLAKVPLRLRDSTGGPGGSQAPAPDVYRNLLGVLASGHLDLIIGDDSMVDYSELAVSYTLPSHATGDLDGDGRIDRNDLDIILSGLDTDATAGGDPRDLDLDGRITVLDARRLVLLCSKTQCAR